MSARTASRENGSLRDTCEEAVAAVDAALASHSPDQVSADADVAERKLAALRDGLLDRLRSDPPARERRSLQSALNRANTALSLVVGVEYPMEGIQRQYLKQARATVKPLLRRAALRFTTPSATPAPPPAAATPAAAPSPAAAAADSSSS